MKLSEIYLLLLRARSHTERKCIFCFVRLIYKQKLHIW